VKAAFVQAAVFPRDCPVTKVTKHIRLCEHSFGLAGGRPDRDDGYAEVAQFHGHVRTVVKPRRKGAGSRLTGGVSF
jgi:hypothetical protein